MREAELFTQADQAFTEYVGQIQEHQWKRHVPSTPEWTVQDLINHVAENNLKVINALSDESLERTEDVNEDVWVERAEQAEELAGAATSQDAAELLGMQTGDRLIHAWDLAHAIGADETLEPALVQAVYDVIAPAVESGATGDLFSAPVAVGPDATLQEKLIAITGRDPGYEHTEPNDDVERAEEIHRS